MERKTIVMAGAAFCLCILLCACSLGNETSKTSKKNNDKASESSYDSFSGSGINAPGLFDEEVKATAEPSETADKTSGEKQHNEKAEASESSDNSEKSDIGESREPVKSNEGTTEGASGSTSKDTSESTSKDSSESTSKSEASQGTAEGTEPSHGTGEASQQTEASKTDAQSQSGTEAGTDSKEAGTAEQVNLNDGRAEVWSSSFLVRVPEVEFGSFVSAESADTFDYAIFTNTSAENALSYVSLLKAMGYEKLSESNEDGLYSFEGERSDSWIANVKYIAEEKWFCIGSGFYEEQKEDNASKLERLFSQTMLRFLPAPAGVVIENSGAEDNSEEDYFFVVFTGMDEDGSRSYIESLKNAGFTIDVDEGDSDGFIWYSAANANLIACDFSYYDGFVKLGCGPYED